MLARWALLTGLLWALLPTASALAVAVDGAEYADRAQAAQTDPAALGPLLEVSSVDGAPVDIVRALDGARGRDLQRRLDQLVANLDPEAAGSDAAGARERAERIVRELPQEDVEVDFNPPEQDPGAGGSLDIPFPVLVILGALALLGGALLARRLAANRELSARGEEDGEDGSGSGPMGRDSWLQRAEQAERDGNFAEALRLRFTIALADLSGAGAITLRPSTTPHDVERKLSDPRATGLIATFERVFYGRREASAADAAAAREGWSEIVRERDRSGS